MQKSDELNSPKSNAAFPTAGTNADQVCRSEPAMMISTPLLDGVQLLWNSRRLLSRAVLAGLVVGLILAFSIPSRYEATVKFLPEQDSGMTQTMLAALTGMRSEMAGNALGQLLDLKTPGAYFTALARSRTVQDRLIDRFDLRKVYWEKYMSGARKKLQARTQIFEDRKSSIITLTVTDRRPDRAAQIANAYVDELNRRSAELNVSAAHRERVFLEQRLKDVRGDLDSAAKNLSEFSSKNATLDLKEQGKAMLTAAAAVEGQLIVAQSELKGIEAIYGADNSRVHAAKARVTELQRQVAKLGGSNGNPTDVHELPSIRKLPLIGVQFTEYYRQAKIQETVFELLTQQYEFAKVREARETATIRVVDNAEVPEKRSFPPRVALTLLVTILFFCGAAAWLLMHWYWQQVGDHNPYTLSIRKLWSAKSDSR